MSDEDKQLIIARYRNDLLHVNNFSQIVQGAVPQIHKASDIDDVDPDWIDDFMSKAERISDEDMQRLWSKMLAGEVNTHGTFSKKAIITLYEMDKRTAEIFRRYCTYAVELPSAQQSWENFTVVDKFDAPILDEEEYRMLEDAGLYTQLYRRGNKLNPCGEIVLHLPHDERVVLINVGSAQIEVELSDTTLTYVGQMLCRLCDWGTAPDLGDAIKSVVPASVQVSFIPKKSSAKET